MFTDDPRDARMDRRHAMSRTRILHAQATGVFERALVQIQETAMIDAIRKACEPDTMAQQVAEDEREYVQQWNELKE